jgi:molybdopterin molybdotransferase
MPIDEALELVLERARALESEEVPVVAAVGRTIAVPAVATVDLPPFPSSAMDGFALRACDAPGNLLVVASILAGRPAARRLEAGEAMAIATGGAIPRGADAVVPVEDVDARGDEVFVAEQVSVGDHVRAQASDVAEGEIVVAAGVCLGPSHVGALAAAGVTKVSCAREPRVAVLATGTELRAAGEPLGPGEIYDSNGPMLVALLLSAGALVERVPFVRDEMPTIGAALQRGLVADVLVTTGGVSVGGHDLVRGAEVELGVEEVFWGVAVKPGKPIAFGIHGETLVFGLPGNPVAALVGFELFVRPALLALEGAAEPRPPFQPGSLARSVRCNEKRDSLLLARCRIENDGVVLDPLSEQDSHMIARAAMADALILIPRGQGEIEAGSRVAYLVL